MSNHIFCNRYVVIYLAIMNLEFQPNKIWQYSRRPCLRLYGRGLLSRSCANNWETTRCIRGFEDIPGLWSLGLRNYVGTWIALAGDYHNKSQLVTFPDRACKQYSRRIHSDVVEVKSVVVGKFALQGCCSGVAAAYFSSTPRLERVSQTHMRTIATSFNSAQKFTCTCRRYHFRKLLVWMLSRVQWFEGIQ